MNKGFTLVELMAVLVLIVIIASIGYAGITAVQRNINQNLWEATVEEIETGAVKYGQDNLNALNTNETCNIDGSETRNCIEVTVEFLINSNYIDTDEYECEKDSNGNCKEDNDGNIIYTDREIITNNVTGEIVNDNIVFIYLENNRVYAQYQE